MVLFVYVRLLDSHMLYLVIYQILFLARILFHSNYHFYSEHIHIHVCMHVPVGVNYV